MSLFRSVKAELIEVVAAGNRERGAEMSGSGSGTGGSGDKRPLSSFVFVNPESGRPIELDGPFRWDEDDDTVCATIPIDPDDYAGVGELVADDLADRVGNIGLALAAGRVVSGGIIDRTRVDEENLFVTINKGQQQETATQTQWSEETEE